jgi:phosphatidylglycerophosphate synthase
VTTDFYFAALAYGILVGGGLLYGLRATLKGRARHERVDRDGGSVFVGKPFMEFGYWLMAPVVTSLDRLGVTPNGVTAFSVLPAAAAGFAVAFGWFGLGCLLATTAALADIVDGLLARRQGVSSDAGEALDAAVDRYSEFFFMTGLLVYYRGVLPLLLLSAFVLLGGYMVSYATVKAEALAVPAPRGSMRRAERAVYLFFGAGFTPLCELLVGPSRPLLVRQAPMIFALLIVAVVANLSVVGRFRAIIIAIRRREGDGGTKAGQAVVVDEQRATTADGSVRLVQ